MMLKNFLRLRPLSLGLVQPVRHTTSIPSYENKSVQVDYKNGPGELDWHRERLITKAERYEPIDLRREISDFQVQHLKGLAKGMCLSRYKELSMLKTPLDLSVYMELFQLVQPKYIIEIGTYTGASALWMDDTLRMLGIDCSIYSMDTDVSLRDEKVDGLVSNKVTFVQGDSNEFEDLFPRSFLLDLPRPLLVIEDADANIYELVKYFHAYMKIGDYFIFEKTNPMLNANFYVGEKNPRLYRNTSVVPTTYSEKGKWKLEQVRDYFAPNRDFYAVDTHLTDLFGYNASSQMNSILRRMI